MSSGLVVLIVFLMLALVIIVGCVIWVASTPTLTARKKLREDRTAED